MTSRVINLDALVAAGRLAPLTADEMTPSDLDAAIAVEMRRLGAAESRLSSSRASYDALDVLRLEWWYEPARGYDRAPDGEIEAPTVEMLLAALRARP